MKKVNFNSLENFEVPEEWIEKALNAKPKKKILFRPYVLGAAASLVLVTALSLLLFRPFQKISAPPVAVSTTEPSSVTEATVAPTAATENPAETENTVESQIDPTDPDELEPEPESQLEPKPEPETVHKYEIREQIDDPSKFRVDNKWELDKREMRPNAGLLPDYYMLLSEDELFTGDITIIVSPDSPFYNDEILSLYIKGYYRDDSTEIKGFIDLEPIQGENGEKTITFNLFDEGVYTPSADYSFLFEYYWDNETGSYLSSKTLTEQLYSDNSVTITI